MMTKLITKDDPRYFSQTSDGSYDRHHYRIVCQNKSFVVIVVLLAAFGVYKAFFANKGLADPWDDHDD